MEEEGSCTEVMTKTWGFRRSTLARREFMEAVGFVDSSPAMQQPSGRGRGRGRGRGKRSAEGTVASQAPKRGRGGQGHVLSSRNDHSSSEGVSAEERASDRAEDSDDLNLIEIRKRAVARRSQELRQAAEENVGLTQHETQRMLDGGGDLLAERSYVAAAGLVESARSRRTADGSGDQQKTKDPEEETVSRADHNGSVSCSDTNQECAGVTEACGLLLPDDKDQDSRGKNVIFSKAEISSSFESQMDALLHEEKETKLEASPQCIGPGCSNDALPESVYCGHQCIVQHAAMAAKTLHEPKDVRKCAASPSLVGEKRSFLAKLFKVKINKTPPQTEHVTKQEELKEDPPCSDGITDAVQPAPPAEHKADIKDSSSNTPPGKPPDCLVTVSCSENPPPLPPAAAAAAVAMKKSTPGRAKKTMPASPRLGLLKEALSQRALPSLNKSFEEPTTSLQSAKASEELVFGSSCSRQAVTPHASPLLIRQTLRRSLSKVLLRWRDQSPDLSVSETEIEKLVVELEREMFSDCYTTDEEYKKKSDRLLLRLKDPRNKELCLQALRGGVPSARLIDLSRQGVTEESTVESEPAHQTSLKSESLSPPPPEKPATSRGGDSPSTASASEYEASRRNQPGPLDSSEHRCLTFDINCKLCPDHKPQIKLKDRPKTEKASWVVRVTDEALDLLEPNPSEIESPASPSAEEIDTPAQPAEFCPVVIPPVPLISISGRDPRKAQYQRTLASSHSTPIQPLQPSSKESPKETQAAHVPVPLPPAAPKSILMKPSHSSVHSSYSATMRRVDCVNGTQQFLSKQIIMWKGFLNMPNVSKFVTKGYLISGSADFLKEDLPDTIHIGGRILPQTVWEYVNVIKTSDAKELSLIRFHPSSEEEEVAYVSLFSYFNSRRRFGVVSNVCKHLKDLYLIPLCSKQSLPSVLLPIEGPGLEDDHPNLIMGLAVSQKPKRPDELSLNAVEKKSESLICEESINPSICDLGKHQIKTGDAEISNLYQSLPTFQASSSTLCGLSSMSKPNEVTSVDLHKDSSNPTPLQTILNTLFGSKKQESPEVNQSLSAETLQHVSRPNNTEDLEEDDDDIPYDPEDYDPASASVPLTPVQASEHKEPTIEADHLDERPYDPEDDRPYDPEDDRPYDLDDDRPYDPEEEYSAVVGLEPLRNNLARVSEEPTVNSEVPYDPEDETLFQEMQNYLATDTLPAQSCSSEEKSSNGKETVTCVELSEQQKILEELNRQIEEQKKQLEEQTETLRLQREAIGFSMAHFSVSNALMSPPPQFGRDEDEPEKTFQNEIQIKDPRIYGKINQDLTFFEVESEVMDKECGLKKSSADETEKFEPCSKKTALVSENSLPNEESQKHKSKSSPLENTSKSGDSRRSTSSSHTSSRRSRHDHRSHRNERASSHRRNSERSLKESSERHHRKTPSDGHPSRPRHRDRSSSKKRHHHRDSSPSRYRSRSHYSTDSRRRGASSLENTIQAQRTDQQETESGPESSQHKSDSKQSSNYSEQSVQLQKSTFKHKQLVEVQQEAPLSTRQEADQDHRLETPRKGSHPVSNKSHDQNQHFSGLSDMFPHETVSLSKQGPLLLSGTTGYGEGLRRQFPKIQPPSTQPLHDQLNLSEPCQADQKRAFPSFNRWNYPETDHIRSRGHPQRGAHSQYQNASLSDNLRCRPFGPDYKGQSCATSAKEGAPALGTGRRQLPSQRQEGPFQERQTDAKLYKACVPPLPEQGVHEDISAHVRMGPRPGTKGFFSPLVPRKFPQHASLRENKSQSGNSFQSECTSYTNNNEQQIPNCPKNYVDDVEGRMQACFPRQSSTLSRNPVHRDIHRHLEGQQFTDNERKHKGEQNFEFRGRQGFFTRDRNMNPTQREGCGDLRRPFSNQDADAPSSGFSPGNRCLNQRDISCFGQPRQSFEFRQKQTDAVPLRLLGPLLPTPPRGPINQSIPRGRRQPSQ